MRNESARSLTRGGRFVAIGLLLCGCVMASSCMTSLLWESADPNEYVSIAQNQITEAELKARECHYLRDDEAGLYYVQKSTWRRCRDYAIRVLGTPVTLVVDAGTTIVVIGVMLNLKKAREGLKENPDASYGISPSGIGAN